jgi:hypothetical protein
MENGTWKMVENEFITVFVRLEQNKVLDSNDLKNYPKKQLDI